VWLSNEEVFDSEPNRELALWRDACHNRTTPEDHNSEVHHDIHLDRHRIRSSAYFHGEIFPGGPSVG